MPKGKLRGRSAADGGQSVKVNPRLPKAGSNPGNRGARVQAPGNNGKDGGAGVVDGTER